MLASSLGAEVLVVGMVVVGMGSGTSCASTPSFVGTKAKNGSSNGAACALEMLGLPTLRVLALELVAFDVFGTTPSITPFPFTSFLDCDEVGFGANFGIGNPCQVKFCTTRSSIGLYNTAYLSKNMGVTIIVRQIRK